MNEIAIKGYEIKRYVLYFALGLFGVIYFFALMTLPLRNHDYVTITMRSAHFWSSVFSQMEVHLSAVPNFFIVLSEFAHNVILLKTFMFALFCGVCCQLVIFTRQIFPDIVMESSLVFMVLLLNGVVFETLFDYYTLWVWFELFFAGVTFYYFEKSMQSDGLQQQVIHLSKSALGFLLALYTAISSVLLFPILMVSLCLSKINLSVKVSFIILFTLLFSLFLHQYHPQNYQNASLDTFVHPLTEVMIFGKFIMGPIGHQLFSKLPFVLAQSLFFIASFGVIANSLYLIKRFLLQYKTLNDNQHLCLYGYLFFLSWSMLLSARGNVTGDPYQSREFFVVLFFWFFAFLSNNWASVRFLSLIKYCKCHLPMAPSLFILILVVINGAVFVNRMT